MVSIKEGLNKQQFYPVKNPKLFSVSIEILVNAGNLNEDKV